MNLNRQLSILLIGTQMATGGAQKLLLDQARWFHLHGHKVSAVFFYDKEDLHSNWQAVSDFPIINLNVFQKGRGKLANGFSLFKGLWSLWRLFRRETIDVVEAFTHDSNLLALPLAWLAGIPVRIATHHGVIEGFTRWRQVLHTLMINIGVASVLVAVSARIQKQAKLEGVGPDRIIVIQNGIESVDFSTVNKAAIRNEAGLNQDGLLLLSVGRLVYQKGHEYLIRAMPRVLSEFSNAKAVICGDGVLRPELEAQISEYGLFESVRLFGMRKDVQHILAAADMFVLPSRWEGLPIAMLEAMMAGLPVIATRVEGVDEVVEHGMHGLLVPLESPDELAKAILQLCRNPEMRRRMGEAARRQVLESYTTDRMCEQYLDVMRQGLGEGKAE